jgi:hypothetical protein
MRLAHALWWIGWIALSPGCALFSPANDYEQGFQDGYAAAVRDNRFRPRDGMPFASDLRIVNPPERSAPSAVKAILEKPVRAQIVGIREPVPTFELVPFDIVNRTPPDLQDDAKQNAYERVPAVIINRAPPGKDRATIVDVRPAPPEPVRAMIKNITPQ